MEGLRGDLDKRSLSEILYKELVYGSRTEILPRGPFQRSCQMSSDRELVQRSSQEILPGDLL